MSKQFRVARLIEPGKPFVVGEAPMPDMGTDDVLVSVKSCNMVPNISNVTGGKSWYVLPDLPSVFGLDATGVVEAVGRNVLDIKVGDRVYVDPWMSCGECRECRRGRIQYCAYICLRAYISLGPQSNALQQLYPYGGLSQFVTAPKNKIVRLPDTIDFDTASRLGYLGTSYAALIKGKIRQGGTLLINGVTGTLGTGAVLIALGLGVRRILGLGRNPDLMAKIKALAPDRVALATFDANDPGATVQWVLDETEGQGAETMYDCLGAGASADSTTALLGALAPEGTCVVVAGGVEGKISRDYVSVMTRDVNILGSSWFTSAEIDDLVELLGRGTIDLSCWETRAFPLERVNEALELVAARPGGFINVVVNP